MGTTFKENVSDIRNSKVSDVVDELKSYGVAVEVVDPFANSKEVYNEYGYELTENINAPYDAVIVAVSHDDYVNLDEKYFQSILTPKGILADVKGIFKNKINEITYLSL